MGSFTQSSQGRPHHPSPWMKQVPHFWAYQSTYCMWRRKEKKKTTEWWFMMDLCYFMVSYCILLSHSLVALQKTRQWAILRTTEAMSWGKGCAPPSPCTCDIYKPECEVLRAWEALCTSTQPTTAKTMLFWWVRLPQQCSVSQVPFQMVLKCVGETEWSQHLNPLGNYSPSFLVPIVVTFPQGILWGRFSR